MKIKQLEKVMEIDDRQRVRVNDTRTQTKHETVGGWCWDREPEFVDYVLNLTVDSVYFKEDWLFIWAH